MRLEILVGFFFGRVGCWDGHEWVEFVGVGYGWMKFVWGI